MKNVNYEQLKTAINAAIVNATVEFEYSKEVSDLLGYDPEQTGWFYRKNENGVIECTVSDGQCTSDKETVKEFLKKFEPVTFSNKPITYDEFVDAIGLALRLDVPEDGKVVEVSDLNELLKGYDPEMNFSKVYAKKQDGVFTIYIDWEETDGKDPTEFTHEEFITKWSVSAYYDIISD